MKVIKNIAYDGAPVENETGLTAKVVLTVGEELETNPMFFATFNTTVEIPFTIQCGNIGEAIQAIKNTVAAGALAFLNSSVNSSL